MRLFSFVLCSFLCSHEAQNYRNHFTNWNSQLSLLPVSSRPSRQCRWVVDAHAEYPARNLVPSLGIPALCQPKKLQFIDKTWVTVCGNVRILLLFFFRLLVLVEKLLNVIILLSIHISRFMFLSLFYSEWVLCNLWKFVMDQLMWALRWVFYLQGPWYPLILCQMNSPKCQRVCRTIGYIMS